MNILQAEGAQAFIDRINRLSPTTERQWGKMQVGQMLAHCCVAFEIAFNDDPPKPNALLRWIIRLMATSTVVGDRPYKRSMQTAPIFVIKGARDFDTEKTRLVQFIDKARDAGVVFFDGRKNPVFGKLSAAQWNNLLSKHLDHHLTQFGV